MSTTNENATASEDRKLTAKEVAAMIGISVDSVYRHVPCIRIAGVVRYSETEVKLFLSKSTLPCARRPRSRFVKRKKRL